MTPRQKQKRNRTIGGAILLTTTFLVGSIVGHHYKQDCTVFAVCGDEVLFEDTTGNIWEYETDTELEVGDKVVVFFDDRNTSTRKDDEIVFFMKAR